MKTTKKLLLLMLLLPVLTFCRPSMPESDPTPLPAASSTPTLTPEPTSTPTPELTATPTQTATPEPTATLTVEELEDKWFVQIGVSHAWYDLACYILDTPRLYDTDAEREEIFYRLQLLTRYEGNNPGSFSLGDAVGCAFSRPNLDACPQVAEHCERAIEFRQNIDDMAKADGLDDPSIFRLYSKFKDEFDLD